jgi:hypothetical protein
MTVAFLDDSELYGTWLNADLAGPGIRRIELFRSGDEARVRIEASGDEGLLDWGDVAIDGTFVGAPSSPVVVGFTATVDLGFQRCRFQGNVKLGVMVLGSFNTFTDDSGRTPYFSRDFLFRVAS